MLIYCISLNSKHDNINNYQNIGNAKDLTNFSFLEDII